MTYYVLFVREDSQWAPRFGDYDREIVEYEGEDYRNRSVKAKDLRIVSFPRCPTESVIQAKTRFLNGSAA